jgi:hypothetical protein
MNDNDRKDLARVLLRAASQALECASPENFSGLRQTTFRELNRIWVGLTSHHEAHNVGDTIRVLHGQESAKHFAHTAAYEACRQLFEMRAFALAEPATKETP